MTEDFNGKRKMNPTTKKLIIIVACVFVIAAIATAAVIIALSQLENISDVLELGDHYMSDFDYESAIREFKRAIEIDPKSEEAYIKLAEAYIEAGDIESAIKTLEDGYEATQSRRIRRRLEELRDSMRTPDDAESIALASTPQKMTYFVGEALDPDGLTLTVTYSDGKTKEISEGYNCDVKTFDEAGTVEVTVKYGKAETTFGVTVIEPEAVEIRVSSEPGKLTYFVGEKLDTSGMILTVVYENGAEEEIREGFVCDTSELDHVGRQSVTVEYNGLTAEFNVTVRVAEMVGISINTLPMMQECWVNGELDITGLSINVVYEDGRTETVSDGFTYDPWYFDTTGEQVVTVEYDGKTTEFTVNVKDASDTISFNGHSYRVIYDEDIGWHDAKEECEKMGGHLATITSEEENFFVYNLASALDLVCWLGGTNEENGVEWRWITGEAWEYEASDFDNRNGIQFYLAINYYSNAIWDDQSEKNGSSLCSTEGYICEWETVI